MVTAVVILTMVMKGGVKRGENRSCEGVDCYGKSGDEADVNERVVEMREWWK